MIQKRSTSVRRRQIVSAARRLIVKHGSEHVTVRRIAKEIGVSEGAIYRHYKSKKEILSFLVDEIEDVLIADVEDSATENKTTFETFENLVKHHLSSIEQRSGISFQVIAEIISFGDKKLNKKIHDVIDEYISRVRDILSKGINSGEIRPDLDVEATAILFFSMTQGIVNMWALSNYSFDLEKKYLPMWDVFRKAIATS